MNLPEHIHPEELIEPFLDGELSPEQRRIVLDAAAGDASFARELALARSIREALRSVPSVQAPPDLLPDVIRHARQDARRQFVSRVRSWFSELDLRPALVTATLVVAVVLAGQWGRPAAPAPDQAEVAEALEQIKWTLGLVSEVGQVTAVHLRDDVFEPHVVGRMQGTVNDIFQAPPAGRMN